MHRESPVEAPLVRLRPTRPDDLPALFEMQSDPDSNAMAGTKPRTRAAFNEAWERNFANPAVNGCVIEAVVGVGDAWQLAGSIACFQPGGIGDTTNHVGYWIAHPWWGRRIASQALVLFLAAEKRRPLHATTASTNTASRRILERCGFRLVRVRMGEETDRYLAREVVEWLLE